MTNIPIRGVGALGVLPDLNPFATPPSAATDARNVRFMEDTVTRFDVFKRLRVPPTFTVQPTKVFSSNQTTGVARPIVICDDGSIYELLSGVLNDVSGTSALGVVTDRPTVTRLAGVDYINTATAIPAYRSAGQTEFSPIPDWSPDDVCRSLRVFKDFMIAINVTKGITEYGNMYKWSDATQANSPPLSWSTTDDASLAGENILNDATGVLVDGFPLGNSFMLYGTEETHRLDYVGEPFIFESSKVFSDLGVVSTDCVATSGSRHYVFTRTDIVVHDGISKTSLTESRVRRRIFSNLSIENRGRCFVYHDKSSEVIYFCYPSKADVCALRLEETSGCNEAAVYDTRNDTWTFIDLPGVVAMTDTTIPAIVTWDAMEEWSDETASWVSREGDPTEMPLSLCVRNAPADAELLFIDALVGGYLSNSISPNADVPAWVEFSHKDFDEYNIPLSAHKTIRTIYPQVAVRDQSDFIMISVGSTNTPRGAVTYDDETEFFPWINPKRDSRKSGRYLTIRFAFPKGVWAELVGYDLELFALSQR